MRLLDLFCGAGGAAMGYYRAGFDVLGVDIAPQPHYPFDFIQADALEYLQAHGRDFDVIHASPPCQNNTPLRHRWGREYPDLIEATRRALQSTNRAYVIENVPGAALLNPLILCGTMFDLRVRRHRLFENSAGLIFPPTSCCCAGRFGKRAHLGNQEYMTITGHFSNIEKARQAMDIDWMNRHELAQAIPPAYTEWIGRQLLAALGLPEEAE
jgi:DNA (cytosine-5)-methyltransferase 1